jgi:hypothetical protein
MRKKSQVYKMFIFSLIVIIVILPYAMISASKKRDKFEKPIGQSQIHVLRTYEKGERVLFFIDQAAYLSINEVFYDMAKDGFGPTSCGRAEDYTLWADEAKCFPVADRDTILEKFEDSFASHLNDYSINLPDVQYDFDIDERFEVVGKTSNVLYLEVNTDDSIRIKKTLSAQEIDEEIAESFEEADEDGPELIGYYSLNPSFRTGIEIDLPGVLDKADNVYEMLNDGYYPVDLPEYFRSTPEYSGWFLNECGGSDETVTGDIVKFCVNTGVFRYFYDPGNDRFEKLPIEIRFAFRMQNNINE